jgi:hypothetical protein
MVILYIGGACDVNRAMLQIPWNKLQSWTWRTQISLEVESCYVMLNDTLATSAAPLCTAPPCAAQPHAVRPPSFWHKWIVAPVASAVAAPFTWVGKQAAEWLQLTNWLLICLGQITVKVWLTNIVPRELDTST